MELKVEKKPKDLKINYTGKDEQIRDKILSKITNYICPKCGGNMDKEGIECMYCGFSKC